MKFKFFSLLLFVFSVKFVFAQTVTPVSIYAHNNQALYSSGETVHSKIYIKTPTGLLMQPINVYIDWYSADGNLLVHQIYLSNLGGAESSYSIPSDYSFSYLRMRMYTMNSLQQSPETKFSDQVIFLTQSSVQNDLKQDSNLSQKPSDLQSDKSISVKKIASSFDPKGRNEWVIENNSKDFINLSVSVVEEESFEQPFYNILKDFNKNFNLGSTVKTSYNDAFIQVKGKLNADSNLLKNAILSFSLFKPGQLPIIDNVPINLDGTFLINQLSFIDSAQLSIQVDYKGKRKQKIPLAYQQMGLFTSAPLVAFDFKDSMPAFRFTHKPLPYIPYEKSNANEVVVYTNTKSALEVLEKKYASGLFLGGDAVSFNMMTPNAQSFPTIFHYIRGKVPGLQIIFEDQAVGGIWGTPRFSWRSNFDTIKLFLNQVPVSVDALMSINVNEIAFVKAFKPPFLGAALGAPGGAIAVYTKVGDENNYIPRDSKLTSFIVKGFTSLTPYIQPDYSSDKKRAIIDRRKTLHWVSTIHLNQKTQAERIVYYNNDRSKKHRVIIEGVKENGELIRKEWIVE
jgi:hypothetical protein